jgi:hypothetical protein
LIGRRKYGVKNDGNDRDGNGVDDDGVAVVVGGLVFEAMFLVLSRALRVPVLTPSIEYAPAI